MNAVDHVNQVNATPLRPLARYGHAHKSLRRWNKRTCLRLDSFAHRHQAQCWRSTRLHNADTCAPLAKRNRLLYTPAHRGALAEKTKHNVGVCSDGKNCNTYAHCIAESSIPHHTEEASYQIGLAGAQPSRQQRRRQSAADIRANGKSILRSLKAKRSC